MIFPILYKRTSSGSINQWQVILQGETYFIREGLVSGKLTETLPTRVESKNAGKKNETNLVQQAEKECKALLKKKLKSNYFEDIKDIDTGFLQPQLAKPCKDFIEDVVWEDGQIVDNKLNGFACIVRMDNGKPAAFTRTNEVYHSIPHILKDLEEFFEKNPDAYLQGELYNEKYVTQLNKISELIAVTRKEKDITNELLAESEKIVQLHLYDGYGFNGVTIDTLGLERRIGLMGLINKSDFKYIHKIKYKVCWTFGEMETFALNYIETGGEGAIIRNPKEPYEHKRTKNLLKFKKQEDAEFKTLRFEEGNGNWTGASKAVWCELPNGVRDKEFKSNVDGTLENAKYLWQNRENLVGKWITVRFQEYSPYGVPLIGYTNMVVRDEVEG